MGGKLLNIASVAEYNDMLGVETLHPLVSVIDLSKSRPMRHMRQTFSFYALFLKDVECGNIIYGRQRYDYQKGTIVCVAPGQVIGIEDNGEVFQPKGWALCFDPDIIRGTSLAKRMSEYSYFSYNVNEALHISQQEREIFIDCLNKISLELNHSIDRLSKRLISVNIELLLDYCLRFYERQFITREAVNSDLLSRFETIVDEYLHGPRLAVDGLPNVKWCAGQLCLSANYFSDLIKKETGKTAKEHIQSKIVELAKTRLLLPDKTISQISYELGFQYPQHFTRLFKNAVGITPNEFRNKTNA